LFSTCLPPICFQWQALAEHIPADRTEAFPHNGVAGSTNTAHGKVTPTVSCDPASGSTYIFWDEILEGFLTNEGVSGQKFDFQWSSAIETSHLVASERARLANDAQAELFCAAATGSASRRLL
jgi:hypothetical protein